MADSKISLLTALAGANVAGTDLFPIVDVSATTTKNITVDELAIYLGTLATFDITSLDDVADVTITTAANGDLLKWNGTAWVNAAGYALLASPTFTGTPTLPTGTVATTQTAADNTTAVATTAFVTTADNLKANLASPTFTGTPAAPTAVNGTSSTQVATTEFANPQGDQYVLSGAVFNS